MFTNKSLPSVRFAKIGLPVGPESLAEIWGNGKSDGGPRGLHCSTLLARAIRIFASRMDRTPVCQRLF
jgi:hypothetical protein